MSDELPDPLVSADVDLRGFEFMPFYGDRLFKSRTWIEASPEAKIAALRLWWQAYGHETPAASLPDNDVLLADYAGYGVAVKAWLKIKPQAMRGWVRCCDGRLYHPFVAELATEAWKMRKAQRDRTEKARQARLSQKPKPSVTENVTTTVTKSTGQDRTGQDSKPRSRASTATAAASTAKPPDPVKDEIWKTGRQVLESEGKTRDSAGSFLGKLCKDYGQVLVLNAVRDCVKLTPAKPSEWLVARCQERRANAENKQVSLEERNRKATDGWMPPEMRENHAIG